MVAGLLRRICRRKRVTRRKESPRSRWDSFTLPPVGGFFPLWRNDFSISFSFRFKLPNLHFLISADISRSSRFSHLRRCFLKGRASGNFGHIGLSNTRCTCVSRKSSKASSLFLNVFRD